MIPIPKFKKGLRTSIPVVAIFTEEHTIKEYLVKTAKNYLRLGGDKNMSWQADASLDRVALEMSYKLESYVVETIVSRDLIKEMVDQYSLGIEIMDFDTEEDIDDGGMFGKRKCRLAVKISLGYWAILSIKFLSNLKKRDKQVYGFMKNLIETLYASPMMPCATQEDCFDMYSFIIDERAEEDEEYKEKNWEAVKNEIALFLKHFRPYKKKVSYKKRLKLLEEQYHYIPPEVIFYSPMNELVVWTSPPQIRTLFFHKNTGIKTGKAPVPATLFAVKKKGLYVWALKENSRPALDTPLFHTPFYNVYPHGTCLGNMTVPKRNGIQTIKEWERLFFESAFTSEANPVLRGISGKELWTSLIRSDKKDFPVKYLKPFHKKTVKDIPEILERRIR